MTLETKPDPEATAKQAPTNFAESIQDDEVLSYRSPSVLAIATLILGVISVSALAHPVLWTFPVITLIVGGFALRQIALSEGSLTGKWAAALGICLAIAFLTFAPARLLARQQMLVTKAEAFAQQWLRLLRQPDGVMRAHQLTMHTSSRQAVGASLDEHYALTDPAKQLEDFATSPEIKLLSALPGNTEFILEGSQVSNPFGAEESVGLKFRIQPAQEVNEENGSAKPLSHEIVYVTLRRRLDVDKGVAFWRVDSAKFEQQP